jgi:hypothetical protein
MKQTAARLLALIGPLAVVLVWSSRVGLLDTPDPTERPRLSPDVRVILEERLPEDPPVVVLGNSQAESAVDEAELGRVLGVGPTGARVATVGGTRAAFATALLARWLETGHPKLILVPMSLEHLLDVAPPTGVQRTFLDQVRPLDLPALDGKVFGSTWPRWDKAIASVQADRDAALEVMTSLPLRWTGAPDPAARMDRARDAVFGELGGAQFVLNARMIPVVEREARAAGALGDLDATLLPDMLELARARGVKIVIVTMPQQAKHLSTQPQLVRDLAAYVHERGGGFVHLETVAIPTNGWADIAHLNATGASVFTDALASALQAMGAMSTEALKPLPLPPKLPVAERLGPFIKPKVEGVSGDKCLYKVKLDAPKSLSDAATAERGLGNASPLEVSLRGQPLTPHTAIRADTGCVGGFFFAAGALLIAPFEEGPLTAADLDVRWTQASPHVRRVFANDPASATADVWWLPAGGTLTLTWDEPLDVVSSDARMRLLLSALDERAGTPTVSLDGAPLDVANWGSLRYVDAPLPPRTGPTKLVLTSPDGTPDLLIRQLVLRDRGVDQVVIGKPGEKLDRLGVVPGELTDVSAAPKLGVVDAHGDREGLTIAFDVPPPIGTLFDARMAWLGSDPFFVRCYPFDITPDTASFQRALYHMEKPGRLAVTVGGTRSPEPDWKLVWREDRVCKRHLWIMPGETATISPRVYGALYVPADEISVELATVHGEGSVHVVVEGLGQTLVDQTLDAATLDGAAVPFRFSQALPPWPRDVRLTVTASAGVTLLLGPSELHVAAPPTDAWFAQRLPQTPRPPRPEPGAPGPDAPAEATPTEPVAPPAPALVAGAMLKRQADVSSSLDGYSAVPKDRTSMKLLADAGGPQLQIATQTGFACFPDVPTTAPFLSHAQVRADGAEPAKLIALDARWMDARGRPLKDAQGQPVGTHTAVSNVGEVWTDVSVTAPPPPPGAALARVCVRRAGPSEGVIRVRGWELAEAKAP